MGAGSSVKEPEELPAEDRAAVLSGEISLEGIAKAIKDGRCRRIIVAVGAGMSVSAGIPDFRTPGTGLYDNLQKYGLPTPQSVFTLDYFRENPQPFCQLAGELFPGGYSPTPGHAFVKLLHQKGLLLRCYTQNIDNLERIAGLPPESLVEAHGSFSSAACIDCGAQHRPLSVKEQLAAGKVPKCGTRHDVDPPEEPPADDVVATLRAEMAEAEQGKVAARESLQFDAMMAAGSAYLIAEEKLKLAEQQRAEYPSKRAEWERGPKQFTCTGLVKPGIVFFGESLPRRFHYLLDRDGAEADLLLVVGTSLAVMPFAGIVGKVGPLCPRVLVNRDAVGVHGADDQPIGFGNIGFRFGSSGNYRDVFAKGTCDGQLEKLADLLGWGAELRGLSQQLKKRRDVGTLFSPAPAWSEKLEREASVAAHALHTRGGLSGEEEYSSVRRAREGHVLPEWTDEFLSEPLAYKDALCRLWADVGCAGHWKMVCEAAARGLPDHPAAQAHPKPKRQSRGSVPRPRQRSSSGAAGASKHPPPQPGRRRSPPRR
eukprot:TRINITY_DN770_c2_g1_i1.p1 TRINITY_DN770_c2_g1~~TRINITY_DN770_c2_g1_i1.p1  ORF type:complete len:540 (+),score=164.46 TRINITY_DN770_c2_g1_i1:208-1827(+)